MNVDEWVRLEIRVFFVLIFAGVLFIMLSFIKKPNNLLKSEEDEAD
jgi:hypothetical protein